MSLLSSFIEFLLELYITEIFGILTAITPVITQIYSIFDASLMIRM